MKEWSHLPNSHYIDWVLASLKENLELWSEAWDAALDEAWNASGFELWYAARDAALPAARSEAWDAAWDATRDATWAEVSLITVAVARSAARAVILALITYDDCDQFLNIPYEKLRVWAVLSEDPRAVLLLPMIYVKEQLLQEVAV